MVIQEIRRWKAVRALGASFENDVTSVYDHVAELQQGVGLKSGDVKQYSEFFKGIAAALPNFYKRTVNFTENGVTLAKDLIGVPAIRSLLNELHETTENKMVFGMDRVKPLKAYKWVLDASEANMLPAIITWAASNHKAGEDSPGKQAILDIVAGGGDDMAIVPAGYVNAGPSSSSSSSASSALVAMTTKAKAAKVKAHTSPEQALKDGTDLAVCP